MLAVTYWLKGRAGLFADYILAHSSNAMLYRLAATGLLPYGAQISNLFCIGPVILR